MHPVSPTSFMPRTLDAGSAAADTDSEVAACLRQATAGDVAPALVVCVGNLDDRAGAYRVHCLCEASAPEGSGRAPWLPFADAAFATVLLYRVTRHDVDIELLLGEAARVLRPGGRLLVLEHAGDFAFAPLPASGPAHLLHAWLRQAGFADIEVGPGDGASLLAVARN